MMKIAFVIRNDALTKGGGDIDQAKQFSALIAAPGRIATTVVRFAQLNVAEFDLIVLFNIDMPFENYLVARDCVRKKIPYVIYTLHPKAGHVEEFLRHGTIGAQQLAARASGYSLVNYETIACVVRLARSEHRSKLLSYRSAAYSARYVLRNASRVLVSCEDEAKYIRRDFSTDACFETLPHLLDETGIVNSVNHSRRTVENYVLCAGRIEPRKNQLAVVEIAKSYPHLRFLFLGKKNMNHSHYIRTFERAVDAADNMEWRDQVPLLDLQRIIGTACAYINLSWFEVFSLIDLMALTSRTPSVLSTGSYLYDQTRSTGPITGVEFADPNDIVTAGKRLASLPTQVVGGNAFMDKSWTETAIRKKWTKILSAVKKEHRNAV
jgi:glycosyltransferase involved in cell wall biosynthesis